MSRCDLHVHSIHSTDSGNYALRRASLGESYTQPERVYRACKARGMTWVTITDHNTLEGALRIAELPDTFLSVEVTTRFPEDDVPLHVLVWNLTEEDHRDLQPLRPSVYELAAFLRERDLAHALAHPLYRMGPPITVGHVERMMLLFGTWEGRNGARSRESNDLACRLAAAVKPDYLAKLAERHGLAPAHAGRIALTAGSDDHSALDIATTWTEAEGPSVPEFLEEVMRAEGSVAGAHGSTLKLAHAVAALLLHAYRDSGAELPDTIRVQVEALFDRDAPDAVMRHREIADLTSRLVHLFGGRARSGGMDFAALSGTGKRLGALAFAAALQVPYLASARHHSDSRADLASIEKGFFGISRPRRAPRALVFTDTFAETNGVAGTMRRLASAADTGAFSGAVVVASHEPSPPGVVSLPPDWTIPLPTYDSLDLRFPLPTDVLDRIETEQPDVIHVATPGPVGFCGLAVGKLLGIPVVGSYHTELGPYALHLTRDLLVAQALDLYVDWFYKQCATVLAPTTHVAAALEARGLPNVGIWGRGVDCTLFDPTRRDEGLRSRLLEDGEILLLSVGRLSEEKRLSVLLDAYARVSRVRPGLRLAIVGDGPARAELQRTAPRGTVFVGEAHGEALACYYACADVFCFPSTTDTFGQVLLEAGASGLPVVAAAAGGGLELVNDGRTGLLVAPDDAGAFAAALFELIEDPARRAAFGAAGRAAALERTWDSSIGQLAGVYREVGEVAPRRMHAAA
jgi:glycosyltransferase involved in cell wall biosynthesis/predicted metal-dependent phosphoesterase TrpH